MMARFMCIYLCNKSEPVSWEPALRLLLFSLFSPSFFWLSDVTVSFQMGSAWQACQSPARYAKSSSPGPRPSLSTASPARRSTAMLRWINISSCNRTQSRISIHAVGSFCLRFLLFIYFFYFVAWFRESNCHVVVLFFLWIMNISGLAM